MANSPKPLPSSCWNDSQRRALFALLAIFLVVLTIRYALNRQYIPDPQPAQGIRAADLASQINPNEADWQTLSAIPSLGEKRAKEIVNYRQRITSASPGAIAFKDATDLLNVRGIGQATMENIKPYLVFPNKPESSSAK